MERLFDALTGDIALVIEAVAVLVIAIGSLDALFNLVRLVVTRAGTGEMRDVWMRYAHWLVAGLTFQLAGDIIRTAITPSWDDLGQLAAIAVIRTFLTYFLDRDMNERRRMRSDSA